ncbi:hypothetical protein NXF25_002721 [Crotalus adamanteus]|jgi:prefoldin subunit 4
MGHF